MNLYQHLHLPVYKAGIERQKRGGGSGYKIPERRIKNVFSRTVLQQTDNITNSFKELKSEFSGNINPALIFEIEITQSIHPETFENELARMNIHVLSIAENKKGYWVVFSDDEFLEKFKEKLLTYGSEKGPKYDFFNAIEALRDIPKEEKIGKALREQPFEDKAEFIDIELWKMRDSKKHEEFIIELQNTYSDFSKFRITDKLITKSFVLLRVKLTKEIFDEIIQLKEIARADRPSIPTFNPFEYKNIDISEIEINAPSKNAAGILVIDSGIISNHPMLEKCVGGEENFQEGESELHDTVGHGTAVAGCAAYGDIEKCIEEKTFNPSNWIFSAKVMYAEKDLNGEIVKASYDPKKLIENQFKDAIESFLVNYEYNIKVVNISLGNSNEVWQKHYNRQVPLASLIDELAYFYPEVTFIVSAGNQNPLFFYDSIGYILEKYPDYLLENENFRIINPATSALALTVGSIVGREKIWQTTFNEGQIKTPIAKENQPSPFSRTGHGINGMVKPELVEYGGNLILYDNNYGQISEDTGGKIALLNNQTTDNIIRYDYGTSFSSPKVAHIAGKIANNFPEKSANFINNMLLVGADYPFVPNKDFYNSKNNDNALKKHLSVCGYGLAEYEKAVNSFDNKAVLFNEGKIGLNQIKVYSLELPEVFFSESGKKKITVVLTFNTETRSTRGDSYLGNRIEFHLFHSIQPQVLIEKYGVISEQNGIPSDIKKKFEFDDFFPGANIRKAGCHQKAWKEFIRPKKIPSSPISLVLLNFNKWITDEKHLQDYCISVIFEHEKEIELYNAIKTNIQHRARVR
jgi:subtilisin family serine protease